MSEEEKKYEFPLRDTTTYLEYGNSKTEAIAFILLLILGGVLFGLILANFNC